MEGTFVDLASNLAPDDDLLMLDDNVEAVAADLLGPAGGTAPPSSEPAPRRPLAVVDSAALPADAFDPGAFEEESIDDESLLEEVDDLELSELDGDLDGDLGLDEREEPRPTPAAAAATPVRAAAKPAANPDDLLDLEDLDDIDLGAEERASAAPAAVSHVDHEPDADPEPEPEAVEPELEDARLGAVALLTG